MNLPTHVNITLSVEDIARRWVANQNCCIIDWNTLNTIVDFYRLHGPNNLSFDTAFTTYVVKDEASAA